MINFIGAHVLMHVGQFVPVRRKSGKPVILNLVYYTCPMLCNLVLNGQLAAVKDVAWTAGAKKPVQETVTA